MNPEAFSYKDSLTQLQDLEKALGKDSTSLYSKNNNQSTVDEYQTQSYQQYSAPDTVDAVKESTNGAPVTEAVTNE